jgi:3'-phosphoadenosine 5'-phosphosulfate sulfotransferase (PAPS reductase)/FAD synthetase
MADLSRYATHALLACHRRQVDRSRTLLLDASAKGPLVVATSWGKDSVVLTDLAIETLGRVPLFHMASPYRLPGWERVAEHFAARTDVHEIPSHRTLTETIAWLHEVGLGYERSRPNQQRSADPKKDTGTRWCHEHGIAIEALGLRAAEAKGRRSLFRARGPIYYSSMRDLWIVCPLAWWSTVDVWAYIAARGLPYHPLYDCETHGLTREQLRNSGWLTTVGAERGRIAWLRAHYPEQYRALRAEFPQVTQVA